VGKPSKSETNVAHQLAQVCLNSRQQLLVELCWLDFARQFVSWGEIQKRGFTMTMAKELG
jgi:hypothetical protein